MSDILRISHGLVYLCCVHADEEIALLKLPTGKTLNGFQHRKKVCGFLITIYKIQLGF